MTAAEAELLRGVFDGVRIVEVAQWAFVPAAGALLADLGADVIKIEHATKGDPYRALNTLGMGGSDGTVNYIVEQTNRGKRSLGLNLQSPGGREILYRLTASADVFLTNYLPNVRRRLQIDVKDIQAVKPSIVYARGHGQGNAGPDADLPGYDGTSFWARGGLAHAMSADGLTPGQQRPALGDRSGALALGFAIAAGLFRKERTGAGGVVDVSLLGTALWVLASDMVLTRGLGSELPRLSVDRPANPVATMYRTSDGRWLSLIMLESDRWWGPLCEHLDDPAIGTDPRFADSSLRATNAEACHAELARIFGGHTLDEWRERLATMHGPWAAIQNYAEAFADPQVEANGYVHHIADEQGRHFDVVAGPAQFDGRAPTVTRAPEHAEHTEEILLELGYGWDDITSFKDAGAVT